MNKHQLSWDGSSNHRPLDEKQAQLWQDDNWMKKLCFTTQ
jgi:hypothetical protein